MTTPSIYYRYRLVIFAFFAIATPFAIWGANQAVKNNSNNIEDWLPPSFEETKQLLWFADEFGSDAFLMVSWEGCSLEDPRATSYATELRKPFDVDTDASLLPFHEVISGTEAFEQMMEPPLELSRRDAKARLGGWAVGQDGETSCVVAVFTVEGAQYRHAVIDHMYSVADRVPGLSPSDLRMAGSVVDSVAIDRASNEGLVSLSIVSFSLCFLLMYLLFRSFLLAGMVFLNALFCQQMSLALIHFSGTQMDSVLLIVPLLVFVLVVSAGVHLANYYRDAVRENGLEGAPLRAVLDAISPCWLASLTTALGLGSLLVSFLVPVRKFGTFACLAVVLGTAVLFLLLPAQMEQAPPRRAARNWKPNDSSGGRFWDWVLAVVRQLRYPILAAALLLTAVSLYGVFQLRASVRIHAMFLPESRILKDYEWLEDRVGPLVPVEVVLRFPKQEDGNVKPSMLLRMQLVDRVHQAALNVDGIGAALSAWNFCPPMQGLYGRGARQIARRSVFEKNLIKNRDAFQEMALLRENAKEELWRVSGRAFAGMGLDYTGVMEELAATVDPILDAANQQGFGGVTAIYCGGVPLVQKAQDQMMKDLIKSFIVAFAFIGGMMIVLMFGLSINDLRQADSMSMRTAILLRSGSAGAIAMLPNILPCVAVLGAMGLAHLKIEIGSMMTASVALGIAVDDTLHFITWFRRELGEGKSRRDAVRHAYDKCGAAMVQTSCICGFGLLVYSLSPFVPIARFSWVMFAMLGSALVVDLIVLPAILLSPLGATFEPQRPTTTSDQDSAIEPRDRKRRTRRGVDWIEDIVVSVAYLSGAVLGALYAYASLREIAPALISCMAGGALGGLLAYCAVTALFLAVNPTRDRGHGS